MINYWPNSELFGECRRWFIASHGSQTIWRRCTRIAVLSMSFVASWCLRQALMNYHQDLAADLQSHMRLASQTTADVLTWLDHWPVGLKLNTALSHFFATRLSQLMVFVWPAATGSVVLTMLEWSAMLGLSTLVAVTHDLLVVVMLQLRIAYYVTHWAFILQLETIHSLWNLFRGKRWNVLRKRTDSYEYELDQLFLGTLLFTVSAFLMPTVVTYYLLFAGVYQ